MSTSVNVTTPVSKPIVSVTQDGDVTVEINYGGGSGGSGDVVGPTSSTDNAIVRFDGTTGKAIQDSGITIADGATGTLSGTNTGDQNVFSTFAVSGQSNVVADSTADTLTLVAGTNVTITTDAATDSITINATDTYTGDVVGPASATNNALSVFDGTTGKLLKNGTLTNPSANQLGGVGTITASGSGGLTIEASNGTDIGILGSGNTANIEWYGSHNFNAATQDTIAAFTGSGKTLGSLATATYPSLTELSYVKGVTSAIQTQLDAKQSALTLGTNVATSLANNMGASGTLAILGANTFTGAQTISGGTVTSSTPLLSLSQTWNNVSTTFRGLEVAHTITSAATASTHLRIRGGASGTTDRLTLTEEKMVVTGTESTGRVLDLVSAYGTTPFNVSGGGALTIANCFTVVAVTGEARASLVGNGSFFCGIGYEQTPNVAYIRPFGSSTLQVGVSAASPVAHLLRGASSRAGTDSNAAGASLTLAGGVGTGTGGGGDLLFQTAPAGSSGSTANTLATRLRITGAGAIGLYGVTPTARATTSISAASFAANTSGISNDSATFGGYTIGQVVQALVSIGILT